MKKKKLPKVEVPTVDTVVAVVATLGKGHGEICCGNVKQIIEKGIPCSLFNQGFSVSLSLSPFRSHSVLMH